MLSRSARVQHRCDHAVRRRRLRAGRKAQQLLSVRCAGTSARRRAGDETRAHSSAFGLIRMPTRAQIFDALGLWPIWRARTDPLSSPSSASAHDDARRARIAALTWETFAADVDACVA